LDGDAAPLTPSLGKRGEEMERNCCRTAATKCGGCGAGSGLRGTLTVRGCRGFARKPVDRRQSRFHSRGGGLARRVGRPARDEYLGRVEAGLARCAGRLGRQASRSGRFARQGSGRGGCEAWVCSPNRAAKPGVERVKGCSVASPMSLRLPCEVMQPGPVAS